MKKRSFIFTMVTFGILLFFVWATWKGISVHEKYPDPKIFTYQCGDNVQVGSYQITFDAWQWGNQEQMKSEIPDFSLVLTGDEAKSEGVRIGLIDLTVTKVSESADGFDLTNIGFSSGAWGNQFGMELFYSLNPELGDMVLDLSVGESQQVTLPLTVLESNFSASQWANIDSREFYINLQYYPEQIRFLCSGR